MPHFPSKVKKYKEEDEKSIDSSVTDSNAFDLEDSYDSHCDPLHFDYQNKSQVTRTNSSDWSSEEDSSSSDQYDQSFGRRYSQLKYDYKDIIREKDRPLAKLI